MAGLGLGLGLEATSSRLGLAHSGARARASGAIGLGLYLESGVKPAILHYYLIFSTEYRELWNGSMRSN